MLWQNVTAINIAMQAKEQSQLTKALNIIYGEDYQKEQRAKNLAEQFLKTREIKVKVKRSKK